MPQMSPMNWSVMSSCVILMKLMLISSQNKSKLNNFKKMKNLKMLKWMW